MDYLLVSEGGDYFGPFESFRFDALYGDRPVPNIFAKDPGRMSLGPYDNVDTCIYYYVNTYNGGGNYRYLNTKRRSNQNPDQSARINSESAYPDGNYRLWVRGWNIQNIGGDTVGCNGAECEDVIFDNFAPYVTNLAIYQSGLDPVYEQFWPSVPMDETTLGLLCRSHCGPLDRSEPATLIVTFSESMPQTPGPEIKFTGQSSGQEIYPPLANKQWLDDRRYSVDIPANTISDALNDYIVISVSARDYGNNELDANPRTIACRNAGGSFDRHEKGADVNHAFIVGNPYTRVDLNASPTPQRQKWQQTMPDTLQKVYDRLYLQFTRKITRPTVNNESFVFDPPLWDMVNIEWDNDSLALLNVVDSAHDYQYSRKYQLTVKGTIKDVRDSFIDGDGNGVAGGDGVFRFITPKPKYDFPKQVKFIPKYGTATFKSKIANNENRRLKYRLVHRGPAQGYRNGWEYYLRLFTEETPDSSWRDIVVDSLSTDTMVVARMTHYSGTSGCRLTLCVHAFDSVTGRHLDTMVTKNLDCYLIIGDDPPPGPGGPGGDAGTIPPGPDDNWSISDPVYSTPWLIDTEAPVGLLLSGYSQSMGSLLGKYGIKTGLVRQEDLEVQSMEGKVLNDLKVLIVPTGGLRDKEYDQQFWDRLNSYVSNGGNLVVMDQPFGGLFSRLPGNPQARGWEEDLSCTGWFTRMLSGHPAASGQRWIMNNFQTDGYFTWLPPEAQVITRRQLRGGMASTATYSFGLGTVSLSTCYTDFGVGNGQWHQEGGHLVRDLVRLGLDPNAGGEMTEYHSQDTVSITVPINYRSDGGSLPANRALLTAIDPYGRTYQSQSFDLFPALLPGQTVGLGWSGWALPQLRDDRVDSNRGIWQVNYALQSDTVPIQEERTGLLYSMAAPLGRNGDWNMWNQPPNPYFISMYPLRQTYVVGDTAEFRIDFGNNTQDSIEVYALVHYESQVDTTAPFWLYADSVHTIDLAWPVRNNSSSLMFVHMHRAGDHQIISNFTYGFRIFQNPSIRTELSCQVDSAWAPGKFVKLNISARGNYAGRCSLSYSVIKGDTLARRTLSFIFGPDTTWAGRDSVMIDSAWTAGEYRVDVSCHRLLDTITPISTQVHGYWSGSFLLRPAKLTAALLTGSRSRWADTARIAVGIRPAGRVVRNALLRYDLIYRAQGAPWDARRNVYHSSVVVDSLRNGDTLLVPYELNDGDRKLGHYSSSFKLAHSEDSVSAVAEELYLPSIKFAFDRRYPAWGDTVLGTITVKNTTPYPVDRMPLVILPQGGCATIVDTADPIWSDSSCLISLAPGRDTMLPYVRIVDSTTTVGAYAFGAFLLSHGTAVSAWAGYEMPQPQVLYAFEDTLYDAGDTMRLLAFNAGGCGIQLRTNGLAVYDPYGNTQALPDADMFVGPGDAVSLCEYPVTQSMSGRYSFKWMDEYASGGESWQYARTLSADCRGYWAEVRLVTSKLLYFPADSVGLTADVTNNGALPLDHRLDLSILPYGLSRSDTAYLPNTDDWPQPPDGEKSYGCVLQDGAVALSGQDSAYQTGQWSITVPLGKGQQRAQSLADIVRRAYQKSQAKDKGARHAEIVRNVDLAISGGERRVLVATDQRCHVLPLPGDDGDGAELPVPVGASDLSVTSTAYYVANRDSGRVYRVGRVSNAVERSWAVEDLGGMAHGNGCLYVVSADDDAVLIFNDDGDSLGCMGQGTLCRPADVAVDASGNVFVSDTLGVAMFDQGGMLLGRRGQGRSGVIAVGTNGYLYRKDLDSLKVAMYDENGAFRQWIDACPATMGMANDTLHAVTWFDDVLYGRVYECLGRTRGYTTINAGQIGNLRSIIGCMPDVVNNNGAVTQDVWIERPLKGDWIDNIRRWPIDSLPFIDFREYANNCNYGFNATITKTDGAVSPAYHSLSLARLLLRPGDPVWQDSVAVSLSPGAAVQLGRNAGIMPDSGQFLLQGAMELMPRQPLLGIQPRLFEVWGTPVVLTMSPDQEVYAKNENARIQAIIHNRTDSVITGLRFTALKNGQGLADTMLGDFPSQAVCTMAVACTDTAACLLTASVTAVQIGTVERHVSLEFNGPVVEYLYSNIPDTANCRPFPVETSFKNNWSRDVVLRPVFATSRDTARDSLCLQPGYTGTATAQLRIAQDDTVSVIVPELSAFFNGGIVDSRPVALGTRARLQIDTTLSASTGVASVIYHLLATGTRQGTYRLTLCLSDTCGTEIDSVMVDYSLLGGDSVPGRWNVAPGIGRYQLGWRVMVDSSDVMVDSGSCPLAIAPGNAVTIDSLTLDPLCNSDGTATVRLFAANRSAEPFAGSFRFESPVGCGQKDTLCEGLHSLAMQLRLPGPVDPGRYPFSAYVISGGDTVHRAEQRLDFAPRLVIDSLPNGMDVVIGDTARLVVRVANTGNAVSYDTLAYDLGTLCDDRIPLRVDPAASHVDTAVMAVPDDLENQTVLGSVATPDDRRPVRVKIDGYAITVAAALDQEMYRAGDSIGLLLTAEPANDRSLAFRSTAIYLGQEHVSGGYLSGYAHDVGLGDPERLTAAGDTAIYVGKLVDLGEFDSAAVRSEPAGAAWIRTVTMDSCGTGAWTDMAATGRICQYKVLLTPPDTSERVVISRFSGGLQHDTVFERFDSLHVRTTAAWAFSDSQGPQATMFYGVYTSTGRGLWLNTAYIIRENDSLTIIPDKQLYQPGDTVGMRIHTMLSGELHYAVIMTPVDTVSGTVSLSGVDTVVSFIVPDELVAGSRYLSYQCSIGGDTAQVIRGCVQFDIQGYQLHMHECRLSRTEYNRGDAVRAYARIRSSHAYDLRVTTTIRSLVDGRETASDTTVLPVLSGYNWLEVERIIPDDFKRGLTELDLGFCKGQLSLGGHQARFHLLVSDTLPPAAVFLQCPVNTYQNQLPYLVTASVDDSSGVSDTLHYNTGYGWAVVVPDERAGGISTYSIPGQPRGTTVCYYLSAIDEFGNRTKTPQTGYRTFHVLPALPPGDVTADTADRGIDLGWRPPQGELAYHRYSPEAATGLPAA
ncbi:MAG: hypothetical protein MUF78_05220, partial [Candidatus Edwardsbacteria bacterium]|nr:hypothetical protein [Candidatus Edwardsbacteria bacterium]